MTQITFPLKRLRDCESGATVVEFSFIGLALLAATLGLVETSQALYMKHRLSNAADKASREIVLGIGVNNALIEGTVRSEFTQSEQETLEVNVGYAVVEGTPFRTVEIHYPFPLLLPVFSADTIDLSVHRRIPRT